MQVKTNGISVNYELAGPEGAPVVTFSHSLAATSKMWDPQVAALRDKYRVLAYDTRGHGGTEAPDGAYSLDMLAADARALLAGLGIAKTHWVGLSMGGMIGQTIALQNPELFESLSLCDTSSRVPPEAAASWEERIGVAQSDGMAGLVEGTVERWFTPSFRDARADVVDPVREMIRATPPAGFAGCCQAIRVLDLTDQLSAIEMPTLIVVGEDDPGTPVAASEAIHAEISGSELVVLKSAAHLSNLEQPEAFNEALTSFLDRQAI